MARPSQDQDSALLQSGLALYPQLGCAGLSVRRVAEHAGVRPAMLHYHFGGKPEFLRALLQQLYEVMFSRLSASGAGDGPALVRLRAALFSLASFLRDQRAAVARLLLDAGQGEVVVQDFLRANAPRHLDLLMQLLAQSAAEGDLNEAPPLQRFVFVMSSVAAPLLIAQGVARLNVAPELVTAHLDEQVLSDAAIRQRIDWALAALGARGAGPGTPIGPRPAAPAELPAAAPSVPTPSSPSVTLAPSSRRSR